jgi:hypothetical protein
MTYRMGIKRIRMQLNAVSSKLEQSLREGGGKTGKVRMGGVH